MELFANVTRTYKTRANAIKRLTDVWGEDALRMQHWFIIATEDGRYIPCVRRNETNLHAIHHGICVVG